MPSQRYIEFFQDKTVTLLGLGLLGRGVGDAAFLAQHCKKLYVTDLKSAEDLRVSVEALKSFDNIEFCLGRHDNALFENKDFIVKGAGVRLDNPFIAHAKANGIPVYMSTALFAKLATIPVIGITGTRGKTSTTCMIADVLRQAGKKVLLGGNIRGVSTLAQIPHAPDYDYAVLELDSWQMQGFDTLKISPSIGVFTNFYPDHMNYYDGDMDLYLHDKAALFRHQKADDALVTTEAVVALARDERERGNNLSRWVVAPPLPASFAMKVPGAHNLANAALAREVGILCGVGVHATEEALHAFQGVEGRLQFVGKWDQRAFYNDSNATTQEATLAALAAFPADKVVLIFGGADKGLPLDRLIGALQERSIRCVILQGTGSDRVLRELPDLAVATSMPGAVKMATALSKPDDAIVLSPSFASFGMFKNEYDRSDQFMAEVQKLIDPTKGSSCPR